ncbi:MAG TPA: ABC transporter substrate-binding protein [Anaerolineae bacterium]|nr:ABC transporter substrate-binding protein [Anaerolineae bacterium]HIQ04679.1 ABC transporter substrate-binding protein [Anaerolineae bacterium]
MSRKLFSFTMVILLLVTSLVVACAPTTPAPAAPAGGEVATPAKEAPAKPAEPIEIQYWYGLGGKLGEVVADFIKRFNESQDEVKVVGVVLPDYATTAQKLQAAIAAGSPPAAAMLTVSAVQQFAHAGVLQSLDDFIVADPEFNKDDIPDAYLIPGQYKGKQYALPIMGTTQVLYYRKDIYKELGIDPDMLNTWEGLAEAARKCMKVENGEVVRWGWEPMWGSGNLIDSAYSNGARILSEDGKTVLIDQPEWVEVWDAFRKWIHEDKIMRIHYGGEGWAYWYDTIDDVLQGRACGYTGSAGDQGDLDFSIVAAHVQPYWSKWGDLDAIANPNMAAIPAGLPPEVQKAAFKWLEYYISPEMTAEWSVRTGYMPARNSAMETKILKDYAVDHPQILVPPTQAAQAQPPFLDPTGGKIVDALSKAADKVEIENVPAAEALAEAKAEAQAALDEWLAKQK